MAELERDEFETWMGVLREDIKGVHVRLDLLNGRTRVTESKIAVLEDRGSDARRGGMVSGGIGAAIVALAEFARHWFKG